MDWENKESKQQSNMQSNKQSKDVIIENGHTLNRYDRRIVSDVKRMNAEGAVFIALDDLDFSWSKGEANCFLGRWRNGYPLQDIARTLRPDLHPEDALHEAMILALHLYRQKYIIQQPYTIE